MTVRRFLIVKLLTHLSKIFAVLLVLVWVTILKYGMPRLRDLTGLGHWTAVVAVTIGVAYIYWLGYWLVFGPQNPAERNVED